MSNVRVDVRVDLVMARVVWKGSVPMFNHLESVDFDPPATGPEMELRFRFPDMPPRSAEQVVHEYLREYELDALAIKSNRFA